jgi:hypothetical protein
MTNRILTDKGFINGINSEIITSNLEDEKNTMLHHVQYNKDSLLSMIKLLDTGDDVINFLKTHTTALSTFSTLEEASGYIGIVLQKTLNFYNTRTSLAAEDEVKIKLILQHLHALLSRKHDMTQIMKLINSLNDNRCSCYTLENTRLYFASALKHGMQNVSDWMQIFGQLTLKEITLFIKEMKHLIINVTQLKDLTMLMDIDERSSFITEMQHLIKNADDLALILPILKAEERLGFAQLHSIFITTPLHLVNVVGGLAAKDKLTMINFVESHWEIKYRTQCRMAFLGGSLSGNSGNYLLFKKSISDGPRGSRDIKKMILKLAELEPFKSTDGMIIESKYTL